MTKHLPRDTTPTDTRVLTKLKKTQISGFPTRRCVLDSKVYGKTSPVNNKTSSATRLQSPRGRRRRRKTETVSWIAIVLRE